MDKENHVVLKTFVFKDYPLHVVTANARRAEYYSIDKEIPPTLIKGVKNGTLDWIFTPIGKGSKLLLCDIKTKVPLIKNKRTVGTQRLKRIKGQDLHTLTLQTYQRSLILKTLKDYFIQEMRLQGAFKEEGTFPPYQLRLSYHVPKKDMVEDLDNHNLWYNKVLVDCLVTTLRVRNEEFNGKITFTNEFNDVGFIENDNVDNVASIVINYVEEQTDRFLKLEICKYVEPTITIANCHLLSISKIIKELLTELNIHSSAGTHINIRYYHEYVKFIDIIISGTNKNNHFNLVDIATKLADTRCNEMNEEEYDNEFPIIYETFLNVLIENSDLCKQ